MLTDIINIGLAFLEGVVLIISPCILPILPIILSGSLTGNKRRPLGIIIGFIIFFALFTFFSQQLTQYSGIDLNLIRHISYAILLALGAIMLSDHLTEIFNRLTQGVANIGVKLSTQQKSKESLLSGMLFGGLVGLIWTPCAGPILAAVILQTVIQQSTVMSLLTLIAFAIGVATPMLVIMIFSRELLIKFGWVKQHALLIRKFLGAIIIVSVAYIIFLELGFAPLNKVITSKLSGPLKLQHGLASPYPSPNIAGIDAWINSAPLQLNDLQGKVVLIDFWTYSCINCIRTLPYLHEWYEKYHNKGLEIIGVHTPEFAFERNLTNVKNAVSQYKIFYPVALDNHYVSWRNFNNLYWPAHYLLDKQGKVVYTHFGEGEYDVTENNIRYLLGEKKSTIAKIADKATSSVFDTPETYLGYARAENFSSPQTMQSNSPASYSLPDKLAIHQWALQGNWQIFADRIISQQANAAIQINFHAHKVFIVMGATNDKNIKVKLLLNNKIISKEGGKDVINSSIVVNKPRLYEALVLNQSSSGILTIIASAPGLEMYTFTFGQ